MSDDALHNLVSRLVEAGGDIGEDDEGDDYLVQVRRRRRTIEPPRVRIRYQVRIKILDEAATVS